MKKIEFETSNGRFVLVDKNNDWCFGEKFNYYGENKFDALNIVDVNESFSYSKSYKLSEITEEQASEIVDINRLVGGKLAYKDYLSFRYLYKAVDSLYSLFDSKGIYLFRNPYTSKINPLESKESEQKTFKNPYIFKL